MRICYAYLLVAFSILGLSPRAQSGEIVRKTYYDSRGNAVSGFVYQSSKTWRYSRSARYAYASYPGLVYGGFYSSFSPGCTGIQLARTFRPNYVHVRSGSHHRHASAAAFVRPTLAPLVRPTLGTAIRPNLTPTIRPSVGTMVRPTAASPNNGTITMRVYRRP